MQYKLLEELEYASGKGEMEIAEFIEVSPPSARNITDIAPVKCEVMKAVNWAQNQSDVEQTEGDEDGGGISSEGMMQTLELAPDIDVAKVILHVTSMLTGKNGLAKVDGEYNFTVPLADQLSLKDVYGLTGFFLVNFILPSL